MHVDEPIKQLQRLFPAEIALLLQKLPPHVRQQLEEVRIREGRPLEISYGGQFGFVNEHGELQPRCEHAYRPTGEQCRTLLERATNFSLYAVEEELRQGFITVAGGHRIGIVGRTVLQGGEVQTLQDVVAFNVRIAREIIGMAHDVLPKLLDFNRRTVASTLIIAPPQCGKTTLLRDMARAISYGQWGHAQAKHWLSRKVAIVDERSEIAACVRGIPSFDVGPRTDVLDRCPKAIGMMMLLRSMSPDVIIVDEIGRIEDSVAIQDASHAGVSVIASVHANHLGDVRARPVLHQLLASQTFVHCIQLRRYGQRMSSELVPLAKIV